MSLTSWMRLAAAVVAVSASFAVRADNYPNGPIHMIISFPPGNSADYVGRVLAKELEPRLGVPIVVENKGGAGGVIGMEYVARAKQDGQTIAVTSLSPVTVLPAVKKLTYNPDADLVPISLLAQGPMVVVVRKDSPFNTLQELIDYAKANPGKINYGSLGPGTISQMTTELFAAAAGIKLTEIPYKGSAQALTDLIGGQIDVLFDGNASAMRQIDAGTVKGLAVTIPKRSPMMPDTPSIAETPIPGLQNFESQGWMGVFAPVGTPPEVVERLHKEIQEVLASKGVIDNYAAAGLLAIGSETPQAFADFVARDRKRWQTAADMLGLQPSN